MTPRGLPKLQAADYIGCKPRKFDAMVKDGEAPQPRLIGAKKVWDRLELDECFDALPRANNDQGSDWDDESGD